MMESPMSTTNPIITPTSFRPFVIGYFVIRCFDV